MVCPLVGPLLIFTLSQLISTRNAPIILGTRAILYPLATGNTVVFKGSELCPKTFYALTRIFIDAGFPPGTLNLVYHSRENAAAVTNALISHKAVRSINFTGSTATGAIIAERAGRELKPVLLELGGKAPAIVLDDADIETAANGCAMGATAHAGQVCMATERVLVHKAISDKFIPALKEAVQKIAPDSGPAPTLVNTGGADKTRSLVQKAIESGAKVLAGNVDLDAGTPNMRPVILTDVNENEQDGLWYTESFGPQISVRVVEDEEEAIRIANDTDYGLSSAVFTKDLARALKIARRLETGAVHINSMSIHDEAVLPHGGFKKSGFGRFSSSWGLDAFLQTKQITYME